MGRSPLIVKKNELQIAVDAAESLKEYSSIQELCAVVSASDWGKGIKNEAHKVKGIQPQMVYIKIKELGVTCKTKPGKRGRVAGSKINKAGRASKLASLRCMKGFKESFSKHIVEQPSSARFEKYIEPVANGNWRACVKLQCNECMGYEGTPATCKNHSCPLFPLNALVFPNRRVMVQNSEDIFYHTERQKEEESV